MDSLQDESTRVEAMRVLSGFRDELYGCLTARADVLFELTDAVLWIDGPVTGDVSPPLSWEEVAEGTAELVLLVDNLDAPIEGNFVHWVLFGLAPSRTALSEGEHPAEAGHGANGFGQPGYLGPAPPAGHGTHHYVFRLLALDQQLKINGQPSYVEVEKAAAGHVIAEARLVGTYETPPAG
jgi:Raf kinase inhibitor-like protein, YbhB/YbcL family